MKDFLRSGAILSTRPGTVWIAWGDSPWQRSAQPSISTPSVFLPDFFLSDPTPWALPRRFEEWPITRLLESLVNEADGTLASQAWTWQEPSLSDFEKQFASLRSAFTQGGDGTLRKGVPVVFARARREVSAGLRAGILIRLLRVLLENPGKLRVYGFWDGDVGLLGCTPEDLFFRDPQGELRTMALAGTARREPGRDPRAILDDPKERREHELVIEDLQGALAPLGPSGNVEVGATGVVELPTLVHLKTEVRAHPRPGLGFAEIVGRLHPTAALGAFPREPGWDWLKTHTAGRGRFGAPFGVHWPEGESLCVVAIRNIAWQGEEVRLGSGCGVIAESRLEKEWTELATKRESVRRMLGL